MDLALLRTVAGRRQATEYLNRAIAADSNFAAAWAGLVRIIQLEAGDVPNPREAELLRAMRMALKAVALDPSLGEAHSALGWARSLRGEWAAAESSFRRAVALDPRTPEVFEGLARIYLWTERTTAQLDAARQAVEVDPSSYSAMREYALALAMNGRCDEAITRLRPFKSLTPPAYVAGMIIGQCHAAAERWDEAIAEFQWAGEPGRARAALAFLTHALFRSGRHEQARVHLEDMLAGRTNSAGAFGIAVAYAGLGDLHSTFLWLERSVEENSIRPYVMGPMFSDLRKDIRFDVIRRRLARARLP